MNHETTTDIAEHLAPEHRDAVLTAIKSLEVAYNVALDLDDDDQDITLPIEDVVNICEALNYFVYLAAQLSRASKESFTAGYMARAAENR